MLRLLRSAESALVTGATTLVLLAATACNAKDELLAPQMGMMPMMQSRRIGSMRMDGN